MTKPDVLEATSLGRSPRGAAAARAGWGHVLVGLCACILTVTILGSAVYLGNQLYDRHLLRVQVRAFVDSLENRTPEQLAERAAQLASKPKVARFVLPELLRSLGRESSEQQQCSTIQVLRVFLDDSRVEKALLKLRRDPREEVAATAIEALAGIQPPERAADLLGACLEDGPAAAVVDAACGGLVSLGAAGAEAMRRRSAKLTVDRRVWLVGYVKQVGSPDLQAWWALLSEDPDPSVREAAKRAMGLSPAAKIQTKTEDRGGGPAIRVNRGSELRTGQ